MIAYDEGVPNASRPVPAQARSRRRYDAICASAEHVLRTEGIVACTMAAVAGHAGMTPASLYRYFPNIDALLYEVAARQLDAMHERLDDALSDLTSADEARAAMLVALDAYEEAFRSDRAMREIWAGSLALPSLVDLNIRASLRNAALIVERLDAFRDTPIEPERAFLYTHLIGSGVLLLLQIDQSNLADIDALRDELREMMIGLLDEHRSDERRQNERRHAERRSPDRRAHVRLADERRTRERRASERRGSARRMRDLHVVSSPAEDRADAV